MLESLAQALVNPECDYKSLNAQEWMQALLWTRWFEHDREPIFEEVAAEVRLKWPDDRHMGSSHHIACRLYYPCAGGLP